MKKLLKGLVLLSTISLTTLYAQDFNALLNQLLEAVEAVGEETFKVKFKGKEIIKEQEEQKKEASQEPAGSSKDKPKGTDIEEITEENIFAESKDYTIYPVLELTDELIELIVNDVKNTFQKSPHDLHKKFDESDWIEKIKNRFKDKKYLLFSGMGDTKSLSRLPGVISEMIKTLNKEGYLLADKVRFAYSMQKVEYKKTNLVDLVFQNFELLGVSKGEGEDYSKILDKNTKIIVKDIPADTIVQVVSGLWTSRDVPTFSNHKLRGFTPQIRLLVDNKYLTEPIPANNNEDLLKEDIQKFNARYIPTT
jgi:DNA-directed RNA polymerase specialized sigma54-like protein